jgi:hypothetical protein
MSDSREIETSESSENGSPSRTKYEMPPSLQEKLQDIPGALKYIKLLEKQLKKQRRKLRKIRTKYKVCGYVFLGKDGTTSFLMLSLLLIAQKIVLQSFN